MKVRTLAPSFIGGRLVPAGEVVDLPPGVEPGGNTEPVDDEAKKASTARQARQRVRKPPVRNIVDAVARIAELEHRLKNAEAAAEAFKVAADMEAQQATKRIAELEEQLEAMSAPAAPPPPDDPPKDPAPTESKKK